MVYSFLISVNNVFHFAPFMCENHQEFQVLAYGKNAHVIYNQPS